MCCRFCRQRGVDAYKPGFDGDRVLVNTEQVTDTGRIAFLDGFRGIAILLVVCYHYFSHFASHQKQVYPYGDVLAAVPVFEFGFYGVMLFFVVSGFVIAMTLERTKSLLEFVVRRFARLWPTMLLCSLMTYLVLLQWPMFWQVQLVDFLPSLTFLDGKLVWDRLIPGLNAQWIDGVYWTLFVEVRFYFYAGLVYFLAPRQFSRNMLVFVLAVVGAYGVCRMMGEARVTGILHDLVIAPYLPWFTGGLAAYDASRGRLGMALALGSVSLGLMAWLWLFKAPGANLPVALLVAAMFAGGLWVAPVRRLFSIHWLSVIGVSSYSLYLLHQYIGLTVIAAFAEYLQLSGLASLLLAVAVGLAMIGLSWLVYRYWEQPLNRWIVRAYVRHTRPAASADLVQEGAR